MTIDAIYELFIWDESLTDELYEERVIKGVNEAKHCKYLFPFLQPIIPGESKTIWEPCSKVVAAKTDEELKPYLYLIFEWLQDMNWPGAWVIFERLSKMTFSTLKEELEYSKQRTEREKDTLWYKNLDDFEKNLLNNSK